MQNTLSKIVELVGTGLHSGTPARLRLIPAPAGCGVLFRRSDIRDGRNPNVPARWDMVCDTTLNTLIANEDGVSVSTIEHLMAAFCGCGVHNAVVEIDGPEVPIFDGSSHVFAQAILNSGIKTSDAPLEMLRIRRAIQVRRGDAYAQLFPASGLELDVSIDFADGAIGYQACRIDMANGAFLREIADCRTFCRIQDVAAMKAQGRALGGSYENAVVVDGDQVLSPGGMRRDDECVRHKMLDALGDLGLAGMPILARYRGHKAGHALTNLLLHELFSDPMNYRVEVADAKMRDAMPGMHVSLSDLAAVV